MDVGTLSLANAKPISNNTAETKSANKSVLSSDFETFLRMLTVQMRNQDPLNPSDPSDFAAQLATFASVEQQVRSNELLEQMTAARSGNLAGWIGLSTPISGEAHWFDENAVSFDIPSKLRDADANRAQLRLSRDDGSDEGGEVDRFDIAVDASEAKWDPTALGLAPGRYKAEVLYYKGDDLVHIAAPLSDAKIIGARFEDGKTVLELTGGSEIDASVITALRQK